ncbi:hypothetical protein [Cyanobium sp. WAJ14-Wanaka]|uniref:hypothetical protein n=1 Tax=Cyanobium sp. WAJ14-Wanaka TaxID=2823725 RepID=UPI0020CFDD93|nr:hypothetical protein [Cyanobium sp. WAJ14-Wanaka]MCP9774316.1 hypothetical protein [Cyanobium sp. WAJ14-Wanaka]
MLRRIANHLLADLAGPTGLAAVAVLTGLGSPALAAPFSYNPVSFAGFANETYRLQGKDVFFKNLGPCVKEGQGGYRCLGGEALVGVPAQNGRNFCKVGAVWYVPFSRTVQYRTTSCSFRSDKQRLLEQSQELLRRGLNTLENYSK